MPDEAADYIATPDEGGVERSILRWLCDLPGGLAWTVYGLAPDSNGGIEGAGILDKRYDRDKGEVIYWKLLREQLVAINEDVTEANVQRLITSLRRDLNQDELMSGNRHVHELLRKGKPFDAEHGNGTTKPIYAKLIDFERPERNRFIAVNQMRVTRVKEDFPIYKIGEAHLEAVRQYADPAARASSIAHTTQAHVHPRIDENPRYKRLSERVQDVLSRWQSGTMNDPEAVEALEQLERKAITIEDEAESYRPAEYATYALLTDTYGISEEEAEKLAEAVCDRFEDEIDRTYANWWDNEKARRKAKVAIMKALAAEGHKELIRENFPGEARNYIIENYASS